MTAATLDGDLRSAAERHPDVEAVADERTRLTYADLDRRATALAHRLRAGGVGPGDRVGVVMRNGVDAAAAVYGVLRAGAGFVPISPTVRRPRLEHILRHCAAAAAVADADRAADLRVAGPRLPGLGAVVEPGWSDTPGSAVPVGPDDLAALLYTSGSTGEPKGAVFRHRNMCFVADSMLEFLRLAPGDRVLSMLPLSHTYGLYQLLMTVRTGATLVLRSGMMLPGRIVATLDDERISVLPGVPTLWHVLTSRPPAAGLALPTLRLLTSAGAPLTVARVAAIRAAFPAAELVAIYGQTECKSALYLPAGEVDRRPGSAGVALPGTRVRLERPDGTPAADGEVGELVIEGRHVMQGYWGDEAASARVLSAGERPGENVLRSGDLFRRDGDGFLTFVARKDDVIITRGEKVAPREVEEVLQTAPGVEQAAVVGVPDELLGAAVVAHVSPAPGARIEAGTVRRHCFERLEAAQVPTAVVVHDALPTLDSGKIDRRTLVGLGLPGAPRPTPVGA